MTRSEGVTRRKEEWRATIVLNGGELLDLGVYGLQEDAVVAYNWHLAWLGLDRPLLPVPRDQAQEFFERFKLVNIGHKAGAKFPGRSVN
jgi:hypothetical protein